MELRFGPHASARLPLRVVHVSVAVWILIAAGANVPGAEQVIALLFGTGLAANVVGASLAGAFLLSSLIIWIAAILHLRANSDLVDGPRFRWTIVVYGLFVFGALIYYAAKMRRGSLAAA